MKPSTSNVASPLRVAAARGRMDSVKVTIDTQADALYITLGSGKVARTVEIDDSTNVDLEADGSLHGIEVLSPGRAWPLVQILKRYGVDPADAHLLMSGYPFGYMVKVA